MKPILSLHKSRKIIPVFLAADDGYVKFMAVTIRSIIENATPKHQYRLYILHTDISQDSQAMIKRMEKSNCRIDFVDVANELKRIEKKLALRDYYTSTTYYRLFIADMFPEYDKVLYIDSDTVVREDIANMHRYELGKNYIGAVRDQLVVQTDIYGNYAEKVLGISRGAYFNAGVVLINCEQFRKKHMLKQFIELLNTYTFVVAQDQDYLNILCKDNVLWMDSRWNVQMVGKIPFAEEKSKLVHFNLAAKPWNYQNCRMGKYFWEYAKQTESYEQLKSILDNHTEEDEERDKSYGENLENLALAEIENKNNYYNVFGERKPIKLTRAEVLRRIEHLEKAGIFDKDVEDDPQGRELLPNEVDYLRKSMKSRLRTKYAFKIAHWFVDVLIQKKQFVLKEIKGIENLKSMNGGAVITCNHFHAYDSFAMQLAFEKAKVRRRKLFRVISEANYTSFPGFYGFLMRNCNTLPLSSNRVTMKKLILAVNRILQCGHFILIYPEQSMWWNYRKPKPLKRGAFSFAATNNVPVVPCFITMQDTDVMDADGYPVQEYTVHISTPIYPDKKKSKGENVEAMMKKNYEVWKEIYESTYGIPLVYTCDESATPV